MSPDGYLIIGNYFIGMIDTQQGLSHDLETGCPKLTIVKFWGIQIFKEDHNILRFQP